MSTRINEKTFELNITNELLNLSKSFVWYLDHCPIRHLKPRRQWIKLLNQTVFYSEGLTQKEETNNQTGGYDVSINYRNGHGAEKRLMFLQYKAGIRKSFSNKPASKFLRRTARFDGRSPEHVLFTFNDAAEGTQHSTLRNLANSPNVIPNSVLYVFPRITEKSDFQSKIGSLIYHSSFVPVVEMDRQAAAQNPPIMINDGDIHHYRTSYDGNTSEVNFFFFFFFYFQYTITDLLSELICVQIERLGKAIQEIDPQLLDWFLDHLSDRFDEFVEVELKGLQTSSLLKENVKEYISQIQGEIKESKNFPQAPSAYTTIIPKEGLSIKLNTERDYSSISYQIF